MGLATTIFTAIALLPMLDKSILSAGLRDLNVSIGIVAGMFLASLPLGYWEHQLVVNAYRSERKNRVAFRILKDFVLEIQSKKVPKNGPFFNLFDNKSENSFLTSLLDACIYSKKSSVDKDIFERLSDRWSHFYARKAVGIYAPIFGFLLWIAILVFGLLFGLPVVYQVQNFAIAFFAWGVIFSLNFRFINSYAKKIWLEISHLETIILLIEKEKVIPSISKAVNLIIKHPEYVESAKA